MCGLAGIARFGGAELAPEADAWLDAMGDAVAHRGPDDRQLLRDGPVGLAFRRLAIVGLGNGRQPLTNEDGSVVLVVNGEIFNHRELRAALRDRHVLRTSSDCEILAHLYEERGLRFLDDVRGMFGLALWDRRAGRLLLARDRFGIKPLFLSADADRIAFASEIKALLAAPGVPRGVEWEAALTDPALTAAPVLTDAPPRSWFAGVEHLPAATILTVDLRDGTRAEHRYWRLPDAPEPGDGPSDAELTARYGALLTGAVEDCLMSEVEIGVFLSGGIDSAVVTALAARHAAPATFTVLNASTYLGGDAPAAHTVARELGLENHQVLVDPRRIPSREEWLELLWLCETPLTGPEQLYKHALHRYAKATHPGLKVMLLGQGSDEFNGGYAPTFAGDAGWPGFEAALAGMARGEALLDEPAKASWWREEAGGLLTDAAVSDLRGDPYLRYLRTKHRDLQQYNCWHEDRTAAGLGIESRVPFLDHRLVELAAAVPAERRAALLWDKRILRDALDGLLPRALLERPKVPFFYGPGLSHSLRLITGLLSAGDGALVEEALSTGPARDLVDRDALRAVLATDSDEAAGPATELALRLVNLGLLDRMAAEAARRPSGDAAARPVDVRVPVDAWEEERRAIEERLGLVQELALGDVPALAPGVALLRAQAPEPAWVVAVDGHLAFELEDEGLTRVLLEVDGHRTLGEAIAAAGVEPAAVEEHL
ncbi:MAG TPA: asparagine synthase (glutamine-hydrolyzing), partial [Solirubrobacteraceae bacterium]|nr:asparagine synthase (glutamine-hydrolyzing) [Solirubrobacteraceae bacterium]